MGGGEQKVVVDKELEGVSKAGANASSVEGARARECIYMV